MEKYDIVIVGAGISGLSLASYCATGGFRPLVLEKSERTGGAFHSHRVLGASGGFWLEMGAHTCYNSYRNLVGIIEKCGILDRMISRKGMPFTMLVDGQIRSIPSQLNFFELLFSFPNFFLLKKDDLSIESYYSRVVGRKNFDAVFSAAFNAVISQDANEFPSDMLFKKRERRKDILKKFTFSGGVQTVTDALASRPDIKVLKGVEVSAISYDGGVFSLKASDGSSFESTALALATPSAVASRLLKVVFPDVSERLAGIRAEKVDSLGVIVKKEAVSIKPVAGIIAARDSFFSAVSRDPVPDSNYRGFTFHFRPGKLDEDGRLKRACEVLGIERSIVEHVVMKENIVPSLKTGHAGLVEEIDSLISGKPLLLTGNYFSGLAIEDCISRSFGESIRLRKAVP